MEGEHLTTGWEPDVPVSDSLLRRNLANLEAEAAHVARALGGRVESTERLLLTDTPSPIVFVRRAILRRPITSAEDVDAVMLDIDEFYGSEPLLLMSQWPVPDLSDRALSLMGHPPFMLRLPAA